MSWPSFYGYKYTPIGLRQREVTDDAGGKTYSTTVHLPEGGHLLDIERRFNSDGTVSKRETNCFTPNFPECRCVTPPRTTPRAVHPTFRDDMRSPISDLERQADDIIANFRARQGTGIEHLGAKTQSKVEQATSKYSVSSRKKVSRETSSKEESLLASSRQMRREARKLIDEDF